MTKAECYSNSHVEKTTRAALKSEFDRAVMSKSGSTDCGDESGEKTSTLVILDSLNYIKGYRYELYCISKAAGERHGVIWIMGGSSDGGRSRTGVSSPSDEFAKERNRRRREMQMKHQNNEIATVENEIDLDGYFEDDETMDELVLRYEPPDDKNRWENPLYKVDVTNTLPWNKDGTLDVSASAAESNKPESASLTSQMKAMEVKDASSQSSNAVTKPVKQSASGFKRRGKKSMQQKSIQQQPQSTTGAFPEAPTHFPSSIASRNLLSDGISGNTVEQSSGSKQKMEDVIDGILDSFLTSVALREGMSTLKNVQTESNVLNQVDNVTQRINNDILKAQKAAALSAGVGGRIFVPLSSSSGGGGDGDAHRRRAMNLSKPLYMNELRNCRRQFLKWIAGHPMPDGTAEEELVEAYISYLESNI